MTQKKFGILVALNSLIAIFMVFFLDQPVASWIDSAHYPQVKYWAREITNIGLATFYLLISALFYVLARYAFPKMDSFKDKVSFIEKTRAWSGFSLASFVICGLVIQILKPIIGRQRPHTSSSFEHLLFDPFNFHWHWHSMPSGHTQVMLTAATVLSLAVPRFKWIFFGLAGSIAFTRVILHQHFLSAFWMGGSLGILITLLIAKKIKRPLEPLY